MEKEDAVGFLLDHGANPHIADMSGMDACDHAIKNGMASQFKELARCDKS